MPAPLSIDIRERILELLECGYTQDEIAEDLSISKSAVRDLRRHYRDHGHIFPIRPPGNTPTLTEEDFPSIKSIVLRQPDLTLEEYAELISIETGKRQLSTPSICRILQKLDLRLKKKSKYAEERDRKDVKKKS